MPFWMPYFLIPLLAWAGWAAYLWWVRRRDDETAAGLDLLVAMHWREFAALVTQALQRDRYLQRVDASGAPRSDFLVRDLRGHRWLVQCKHGRAYRIGAVAVDELASAARLAGAQGGILATEGRIEREGTDHALDQQVEVLDGPKLWPLLRPLLKHQAGEAVAAQARRRALRDIVVSGIGAIAVGVLMVHWLPAPPAPARMADMPAASLLPAETPAPAAPTRTSATATAGDPDADDTDLLAQQHAVSKALRDAPGLVRGIWTSRSTLEVDRDRADDDQAWKTVCAILERHPALRTSRIQLNPRPGTDEPVRWRQCHTY